mmetsp:Transcript_32338/g.55971  ORF Transcript_32338/g.55971 Transcript_32338/m.55971 type:complete len:209 (-) Transcript_32338:1529-2155(-)
MGGSASSHRELKRYRLALEGNVLKFCVKSGAWKKRWLRLLDRDLSYSLNIGAPTKNSTCIDRRFRVIGADSTAFEFVVECINSSGKLQLWKLKFPKKSEFHLWAAKVKQAMRPSWDDPKSINICKVCRANFTLTRRQHHCRHCGRSVCANDSKARMRLPELGYKKPVRVCEDCVRLYNDNPITRSQSCVAPKSKIESELRHYTRELSN